jgi:hypothetical protein
MVFKKGVNVTVRRGRKWATQLCPGDKVELIATDGSRLLPAEVVGVVVTPFYAIHRHTLSMEHDPACREYKGLKAEMEKIYPGFVPAEEVTYIMFKLIDPFS